jgi:integrase
LVEWCERLRREGFQRVFPELSWEPVSGYSKEAKRRMSAMLNGLGMPRDNTKVFHSLRHTANNAFIRLALDGQVPEIIRLRVLGHKAGDGENIESYFADFQADENARFVALLNFHLPDITKFDAVEGVNSIRAAVKRKQGKRRSLEDMGPLNRV